MKKLIGIVLIAALIVPVFSGCGGKSTGSPDSVTEIRIWTGESHSKNIYNRLVDQYNKTTGAEKGIKITYEVKEGNLSESIELALQSDQAPEMFTGGKLDSHATNGYIAALEDLPGGQELADKFSAYTRDYYNTFKGKTYSIPCFATTRGLIYNKDMFKEAGIVDENGEPTPPKTYAELREYAKRLTNHDKKEYGIILPLKYSGWFDSDIADPSSTCSGYSMGYNPLTGLYDYNGYRPVMKAILGIKEDRSYMPGAEGLDNDPARARFAEGNIGMKFAYSFDVGVLNNQFPAKCDWGVSPLPVDDNDKSYKQGYELKGFCYINSKAVKNIDADKIMDVYKWLHSDEVIIELYKQAAYIPYDWNLVKDVTIENPQKGWVDFCKMTDVSILNPVKIRMDITGKPSIKDDFLNRVWAGTMTIDELIEKHNDIANEGIEKYAELHPEYEGEKYINKDWNALK